MKKNKDKEKKLPFKQRLFNKMLEKPINDILYVSYELYHNSCRVYLEEEQIPTLEEYSVLINDKLKNLYNGGESSC